MIKIQELSEELARDMILSDLGQAFLKHKLEMENDPLAQEKIINFLQEKEKFEEINKYGKYHPDYKETSKKVRVLKREMDMHPTIAAFKLVETEFESMLEEVSRIIGHSVSDKILIPSSNPLNSSGHKKGCSHNHGCGCSG
jgi:cell fate (sporulation/competence/biofilm development) regulator YlbF (YheA/YmcA/DUF963 family)